MDRYNLEHGSSSDERFATNHSSRTSLHMIVRRGSKIGRLLYGKRIPKRERILLEQLVQARAMYDDVRNEILRGDNKSLQITNENSRKRANDTSHTTLQRVVELVDKGQVRPSHSITTSCGCCSCNSDLMHPQKIHRHPKCAQQRKTSRNSAVYDSPGNTREKNGNRGLRKIRFHNLRSDPCICALNKLRDMKTKVSKTLQRKFSKEKTQEILDIPGIFQPKVKRNKLKRILCRCKVSKLSRSSIEKVKRAKSQLVEKISSSASIIQNTFRLKKDSIMLYRDLLKKKRGMKAWECKPSYCSQDDPCYDIIKAKQLKTTNHYQRPEPELLSTLISFRTIPKRNIPNVTVEQKIKKQRLKTPNKSKARHVLCECKPEIKSSSSGPSVPSPDKNIITQSPPRGRYISSPKWSTTQSVNKSRSLVASNITKDDSRRYGNDTLSSQKFLKPSKDYIIPERDKPIENSGKCALGVSSSFRFEIEFYKQKYPLISDEQVISNVQRKRRDKRGQFQKRKSLEYETPSESSEWIRLHNNQMHNKQHIAKEKFSIPNSTISTPSEVRKTKPAKCACNLKPRNVKCNCTQTRNYRYKSQGIKGTQSTQTKKSSPPDIAYVVPPISSMPEPYRQPSICESFVCKKRLRGYKNCQKCHSKEINTIDVPKISVDTSTSDNQLSEGTYTSPQKNKSNRKEKSRQPRLKRKNKRYSQKPKSSIASPNQSVIRIGSSFSFNVEFYKEKNEAGYTNLERLDSSKKVRKYSYEKPSEHQPKQNQVESEYPNIKHNTKKINKTRYEKPMEYKPKQGNGIKIHKPRLSNKASETNERVFRYNPRKSFLNKCLCTLRLSKRRESEPLQELRVITSMGSKSKPIQAHKATQSETSPRAHMRFKNPQFSPYVSSPPDIRAPYEYYRPFNASKNKLIESQNNQLKKNPPKKQKGSYMASTVQKCLCSLKLHKSGHRPKLSVNNKVSNIGTETLDVTRNRKRRTKISRIDHLSDTKPGFSTQGIFKSHERHGEINKSIRKHSIREDFRTRTHNQKTKSNLSLNTVDGKTNTNKPRKYNHLVIEKEFQESQPSRSVLRLYTDRSLPENNSPVLEQSEEEYELNSIHSTPRNKDEEEIKVDSRRHNMFWKNRSFNEEVDNQQHNEHIGKTSSVGVVLKKCFCTVKLHKKGKTQIQREMVTQSTSTPTKMMKNYYETPHTKRPRDNDTHILSEPLKCIDKRIGSEKVNYKNKSISNSFKTVSSKSKKIQSKVQEEEPSMKEARNKSNKHALRLGTYVNFDVEFRKNKNYPDVEQDESPSFRYNNYQIGFLKSEALHLESKPFEGSILNYNMHEIKYFNTTYKS